MPLQASTASDSSARLGAVVRAFRRLAAGTPGLEVGIRGTATAAGEPVDPERGVEVRLVCARTGAAAVLRLTRSGAVLRAVSAARPETGTVSILEDQLGVHLDGCCRWGRALYASPDDLARILLQHMRRRLYVVADAGPAATVAIAAPVAARLPAARLPRARPVLQVRRAPGAGSGRL
ncbi:MAG TPA: hypothetical protein VK936_07510 [Longimicrobiales bacterium]|nr:hypothetical protein [Longimicrobiales bacterium]